jgi:hypothetical protein
LLARPDPKPKWSTLWYPTLILGFYFYPHKLDYPNKAWKGQTLQLICRSVSDKGKKVFITLSPVLNLLMPVASKALDPDAFPWVVVVVRTLMGIFGVGLSFG